MKTKAALELGNYLKGTFTCVCGIVKSFFLLSVRDTSLQNLQLLA